MRSPDELGCSLSALIPLGSGNPTVGKEQNPIRNVLDAGIVSDHKGSGPELAVDGKQRLDDADARLGIQGTGRLIAQKHFRLLGDGAGNGHTLCCCSPPESCAGKWSILVSSPTNASASSGRIGRSEISVTRDTFSLAVRLGIRL